MRITITTNVVDFRIVEREIEKKTFDFNFESNFDFNNYFKNVVVVVVDDINKHCFDFNDFEINKK